MAGFFKPQTIRLRKSVENSLKEEQSESLEEQEEQSGSPDQDPFWDIRHIIERFRRLDLD